MADLFAHPWGLLALFGVPAVLALHLFRRRFRPRVVSAAFLWADDQTTPLAGRKREPLVRSRSLWCELAAALALGLAFAGPKACAGARATHLVVVLDGSASMGAVAPAGSLAQAAVREVERRIDALSARSRVTLVVSGPRPRLLAGPAAFPGEARAKLAEYAPRAPRHSLAPAVALGLQLAGEGTAVLVTDRFEPDAYPPEVELVALGRPTENLAFTHATRLRDGDGQRVLLTVRSFASAPRTAELVLRAGGREITRKGLELAPGAKSELSFSLPAAAGAVEAELPDDALAIDDRVVLAPVPPRTLALACGLDAETARRLGLASGPAGGLDRLLAALPDSTAALDAESAHLWIGTAPSAARTAWSLVLPPLGEERSDLVGPFLADRGDPLLAGTTLAGVVWSADPDLHLAGTPLVSAGDLPLLAVEESGAARVVRLDLDPARSSLQLSPDWPILLANLAEERRAALPGPARTNLAVGEELIYRGGMPGSYSVRRVDGAGTERTVEGRDTVVVDGLDEPGLYALSRGGAELCRFALSFLDGRESDLSGLSAGRRPAAPERAGLGGVHAADDPLTIGLLFGALVLALLDWQVLRGDARAVRAIGEGGA